MKLLRLFAFSLIFSPLLLSACGGGGSNDDVIISPVDPVDPGRSGGPPNSRRRQ